MSFAFRLSVVLGAVLALCIGVLISLAVYTGYRDLLARQQSELGTVSVLVRNTIDRSSTFALTQVEAMARQTDLRQVFERGPAHAGTHAHSGTLR